MIKLLAKCGIQTVQDVLLHLPYRYQDRTRITPIRDLRAHDWAVAMGEIVHVQVKKGRRTTLHCVLRDGSGQLQIRFFHYYPAWLEKFQVGQHLWVFGEVRTTFSGLEMVHPDCQLQQAASPVIVEEALTPIYSVTQGLSQKRLRTIVKAALTFSTPALKTMEWMSPKLLERLGCCQFEEALQSLHSPPPDCLANTLENSTHPALKRLVVEELLAERLSMLFAKQVYQSQSAPVCPVHPASVAQFVSLLPFHLTGAQQRVSEEVAGDLAQAKPMMRLVQGDVGSGKTVVAALAALQVIQAGYQVAFMAPTELLCEQHAATLTAWFEPFGIKVTPLTGSLTSAVKKNRLSTLKSGESHLLVGTHALFQEKVSFHQLGLVMIDEQHRFGVNQRLALLEKGSEKFGCAHQLLLTATPIPRTLKMTQWSYLEVSVIDELPPTRQPVITAVMSQEKRPAILERLKQAIAAGMQVYWVCPFIETSEKLACQAAVETAAQLAAALPHIHIGLLHGRMKPVDKDKIMQAFKQGAIDLLVATTVIEVGVDVPNASLMVIENAERMGLAQLHQLRGRVGRGSTASYCVLLYQTGISQESLTRLQTLRETHDGFEIAEQDLKYRGAGEFLGTKQTGYRQYKIVNLSRDHLWLKDIAKLASWLIKTAPDQAKTISERWKGEVSGFLNG